MTTKPIDKLIEDTEALEPGDFQRGDYIRRPQAETPDAPELPGMVVSDMESAGYSYLYDTVTREPSLVNNNMILSQLKVTRTDGTLVFTLIKPAQGPWRGSFKCFLHAGQPDRAKYDAMGFPVCKKSTMPNQYQANNHARNRHRDEWRAVEADRETRERQEDRAVQQTMIKAIAAQAGGVSAVSDAPLVSAAPVVSEAPVVSAAPVDAPLVRSGQCGQCGWISHARKSSSRRSGLSRHKSSAH